ncbi:ribosomal protein L11 methyltransferase [Candidatus Kinetoplastibacterium desouzaii TCC079E]|uniref:Ribosomal protein L11 methyltransferase n=1 Tax=Candidatus Kinetoplastidibacterium desouzai TCC079E TaxID=1208919 RepID=M1LV70_9PROT|nr:50S ribosomal protein L11 methyltransferase [Candidatus Kinetoplastibacterium desouzaii]AGF47164.1 ribosomal protein L11 methyltransferase [Candidatus Kinetoplastibacterium desouzaii TCC079E]
MQELVFYCDYENADCLSEALLLVGACSVTVEDAEIGEIVESPIFGEPGINLQHLAWRKNKISVLIPTHLDVLQILDYSLRDLSLNIAIDHLSFRKIPDTDWVSLVQNQFTPIHITKRLIIIPNNYSKCYDDTKILLEINPGMAFGTGSHPTTHLCLEWLDSNIITGSSVLDYGCGSGILSIAASKLGASSSVAIDIDPQAIYSTMQNAKINNVVIDVGFPDDMFDCKYDVVLANILKEPLQKLANYLFSKIHPGGRIVLSGILSHQADSVIATYSKYMKLSVWKEKEEWVCLEGEKTCK